MRANAGSRSGKVNWVVLGCAGGGVLFLLCAGCVGGGSYLWHMTQESRKEAERQFILNAFVPALPTYPRPERLQVGQGKFKGKIVCLDRTTEKIDVDSLTNLPELWMAKRPDEVGAVVWIKWSEEEGGSYPDGSKAMIRVAFVTVVDKPSSKILVRKEIRGEPLKEKVLSGDRVGPKPWDKIKELLLEYGDPT